MKLKFIFCVFLIPGILSCTGKYKGDGNTNSNTKTVKVQEQFVLPEIPTVITEKSEVLKFLANNYWQHFNFRDTASVNRNEVVEKVFVDYLNLLTQVPLLISKAGIDKLMKNAAVNNTMFLRFHSLSEKYLYDPNSPIRNESLYIEVLKHVLSNSQIDDVYKIRPKHQYELACRNCTGNKATDFSFVQASGKKSTLYKVDSPYVIIYFNNPGCGDCKRVCAQIKNSSVITDLIKRGKLKLLSVYPDEDISEWKKEKSSMPSSWINAYNPGTLIKKKELYDLKAIPTLYLLDGCKRVLLKDARFEEIEHYLTTDIK